MIVVFDVISHSGMHLPFNEGYLRTLLAGFPGETIAFHAEAGHLAALRSAFSGDEPIVWTAIERFRPALGRSRHDPLCGRMGAWRTWGAMRRAIAAQTPRLTALLGFDANLLSVLRVAWPKQALLHLVLHNQLAETVAWRTRNPLARRFDLTSELRAGLPANIRLLALELGIKEAIATYAPRVRFNVDVFEHPILAEEWGEGRPLEHGEPLRIAFLGHASVNKGFDRFVHWAKQAASSRLEFHAIGIASHEALAMDQSALTRKATAGSVPRPEYVKALAQCHLACLPLPPTYEYVASGSVIDAVAGLKPIFCYRNASYDAMARHYGAFGYVANDVEQLGAAITALTREAFSEGRGEWEASLQRIRDSRRPEQLGLDYRALVDSQGVAALLPPLARPVLAPLSTLRPGAAAA